MASLLCGCISRMTAGEPDVILSLDSSATSFLEGNLVDQSGNTLYTIETADSLTKLMAPQRQSQQRRRGQRLDAARSNGVVASIQWPSRYIHVPQRGTHTIAVPDALVTLNGETVPSGRLLRHRKLVLDGRSHKFRIDGYKPTFRWKRQGKQYCLYATGNRQEIASLSSDSVTATFRLEVTGTYLPSYHSQDQPGVVSSVLLDHIVLTSLLLVTPPLEWRRAVGATATRMTGISEESEWEEPSAFIYTPSRFDDNCRNRPHFVVGTPAVTLPPSTNTQPRLSEHSPHEQIALTRQPSITSSASSRTLVQSLIQNVLASISSSRSSASYSTDDVSSYYGPSTVSWQTPPPPYRRPPSTRSDTNV
ncbi:hypothetical protein FRB91_000717 [Serendipita sp. 411]|nr:hypothetical protein FRC15_001240 [Serendipita sp. 397]KAG8801394.1 hypothetical protein FRC16_000593 [Serendipita sp. 398]KAG8846512.1 hypothetical protein FRB91_000717 [Serendipita sp. 411]KAG8869456.1 hypothetical protein FRC20_001433 [Serendipita sp. 405]